MLFANGNLIKLFNIYNGTIVATLNKKIRKEMSKESMAHKFLWRISSAALIGLYVGARWFMYPSRRGDCFLCSTGQIETIEVEMVASKPGRIKQVHVHPGETITNGQVVAHMDTRRLEMQLHVVGIALLKARAAILQPPPTPSP